MSALVTVIIPAYNEEKYLGEAIESIINQTYQNWELLIINDGSTDNTENVANHYVSLDHRIKYYSYNGNRGLSFARNYGTERAQGKYVCVFGGDDVAYPRMLEAQVEYLESNPECIHIQGTHDTMDENGVILGHTRNKCDSDIKIRAYQLFGNCVADGASLFRKSVLVDNSVQADVNARCSQDYYLWLHLLPYGKFECIDEPTFKYRVAYQSKTQKYIKKNPEWYDDFMQQIFAYAWDSRGFSVSKEDIWFIYTYIYKKAILWRVSDFLYSIKLFKKIKKQAKMLNLPEKMQILHYYKSEIVLTYASSAKKMLIQLKNTITSKEEGK